MTRSGRFSRASFATPLLAATVLLGGCVYYRLLVLKHQIADFDRNFAVQTDDGVRIICRNPVLLTSDLRWIGLVPERTKRVGHAEQWQVRWVKQLSPAIREAGEFDIVVELLFADDRLTRIAIPERYFALMPKSLLVDLLRSLGGARVDRERRSVEARLASARPDLPGIRGLLGLPSSQSTEGRFTAYHYRYVPVSATRLVRGAVFDLAVYFDRATGELVRWQGITPVGKIGFNFESTRSTAPAR